MLCGFGAFSWNNCRGSREGEKDFRFILKIGCSGVKEVQQSQGLNSDRAMHLPEIWIHSLEFHGDAAGLLAAL